MGQANPSTCRGHVVVSAALGINLVLGLLYAWGILGKALVADWKWSRTDASLPFTVSTASFAIMMIFAGRLQDRIGPRWVAMLGGAMLGLGLMASSLAESPTVMALTFGVLGGIGIGLGYSATTPPAVKWFPPQRKGLVTGIVVSGVGLAAVYVSPLTQYLLGVTTIQKTFILLGAGTIVAVCLLAQLLANPPAGYAHPASQPAGERKAGPAGPVRNADWGDMLRTRPFYLLWLMLALSASAGLMIIMHVAIIAKEQAGYAWGAAPVALLAIFNTVGRFTAGYASDRFGRTTTMALAFALQAANMFAFSYYTTTEMVLAGAAFTGLCYGTIFTLFPATTADYYGMKNLGVNYGIVFTAFGVAGIIGPVIGARIRDNSGSYTMSYVLSGTMLIVAAVLALLTKAPRVLEPPVVAKAPERELVGT